LAWKTLKLDFDEAPMKDVITTLERYFGTEIKVTNEMIYECPYTSTFDQPDLASILDIIGASVGFEAAKEGDGYLLKGNGCQPNN
jgi:ferric-dicitrate binding protein FerR (iron transport regulator)